MNRQGQSRKIEIFIGISLLIHVLFFLLGSLNLPKPREGKKQDLEVTLLPSKKYKIADILPPEKQEIPKKADFLGMFDSSVEKEQVAATPPKVSEMQMLSKKKDPLEQTQKLEVPKEEGREKFAMKVPEEEKRKALKEQMDRLNPSNAALPEDYYPNYKIGNHTYLNVKRYPAISYFVRMKKVFKTTFNPNPVLREYYFSNQISHGQVETVLGVSVDRNGRLANLIVIRSSGLPQYDQEALRTVRESAPFNSPPEELRDKDGNLYMSWTFTVYL